MQRLHESRLARSLASACTFAVAAWLGVATHAQAAGPANDDFANAQVIAGVWGGVTNDNSSATAQTGAGEPSHAGFPARRSLWYKWVAPADGEVTMDTLGVVSLDTVLAVYTGTNLSGLSQVAANDEQYPLSHPPQNQINQSWGIDYSGVTPTNPPVVFLYAFTSPYAGPSAVRFNASANTTYYIAVDTKFGGGPIPLHWAFHSSGLFRWASEDVDFNTGGLLYQNSDFESFGDNESTFETYYQFDPQGALVTVTRVAGSSGRVLVDYRTQDGSAVSGLDYEPIQGTLVFDEFEMSKTLRVIINPFGFVNFFDRDFTVNLSNPRLATNATQVLENQVLVSPPRVDPTFGTATVRILNMGSPVDDPDAYPKPPASTNSPPTPPTHDVFNFAKSHFRVPEDVNNYWSRVEVNVLRTVAQARNGDGASLNYRVNCYVEDNAAVDEEDNNLYPLQPGSDYATPDPPNSRFIHGRNTDFTLLDGTLTFGGNEGFRPIFFTVTNDTLTKFNRDFRIVLYRTVNNARVLPGEVSEATVTILADDFDPPAGSVDEFYNPDFSDDMAVPLPITTDTGQLAHPGADATVFDVAVQPDDQALIVGEFGSYDTVERNGIARINQTDGSLDTSFDPGAGADGLITRISLLPGGKMMIAGAFTSYDSTNRPSVARVNADGSLDPAFDPGVQGIDGTVWALAVQPDGNVLIGGDFTTVNGVSRPRLARLNGTNGLLDTTFNMGANTPNGTVETILVMPSGQIVIGGQFTKLGAQTVNRLAQLNTNGTPDTAFNNNLGQGLDGTVWTLAQANGKILAGGDFTHVIGAARSRIVRLNADGSMDTTFNPGIGADDTVFCITPRTDGTIYLGGQFTSFNGSHRLSFARLFWDGSVDSRFLDTAYNQFAGLPRMYFDKQGLGDPKPFIYAAKEQSDGNIVIGGGFSRVGGGQANFKTRLDVDFPTNTFNTDVYTEPKARDGIRNRSNVARLIGGSTEGAGSISLLSTNYTINRSQGFISVGLVRTNGTLGFASANFAVQPGLAQAGVDYQYNSVAPAYFGSWRQTSFTSSRGNPTSRAHSDGLFGTNASPLTLYGDFFFHYTPGNVIVSIPNNGGNGSGDVDTKLQLANPSTADWFYLGGANTPVGVAVGAGVVAPLTIRDDTKKTNYLGFASPTFAVNESGTNAVITIIRTNGLTGSVSVKVSTSDGTGHAGVNYVGLTNQPVNFSSGIPTQTVVMTILDDHVSEPSGLTVNLSLSQISGALYGRSNAVLNILDNDGTPGVLNFSPANYATNQSGGGVTLAVTRSGADKGVLQVQYATTNGTAQAGSDYAAQSGQLTWNDLDFAPRFITVPIFNNGLVGSNKTFQVRLTNPTTNGVAVPSALGTTNLATVTIVNDNSFGKLQFSSSSYTVNENGAYATINVIRTGGSAQTVSVHYNTSDGPNAVSSGPRPNYVATSGTLTFTNGEVGRSFTVPVLDDGVTNPPNFYFFVNLNNATPAAALGAPAAAQVNIVDAEHFNLPAGSPDTEFVPSPGLDGDVYGLALQPDGKIVVGGNFGFANGAVRGKLARFSANAGLDTVFLDGYTGANGPVQAVVVQTDGRILAAGSFTSMNGVNRNNLARVMGVDGFFDTSFTQGSGPDNTVFALAETFVGVNREILIGGSFLTVNGATRPGLARLNNDASLDANFDPNLTVNGTVFAIAVYPTNGIQAGKILIGGSFTAVDGTNYNGVARINPDGTLDLGFNPGTGTTNGVRALAIQADGKVLLGGSFTNFNGVALNHLARLNINGSLDGSFNVGVGADDTVQALAVQPDNRIIVAGQFLHASGVSRSRLTRLLPDGTVDPAINFGAGADSFVDAVVIQPDGMLVVGGGFTQYDGVSRPHLARIYGGAIAGSGAFEFIASNFGVDEDAGSGPVTVRRRGGTSGDVSVDFSMTDGTAVAGVNYSNVSATLFFPQGETFQTVNVPVFRDFVVTADLTNNLALLNPLPPSGLGDQAVATMTIFNDDSTVHFATAAEAVDEDVLGGAAFIRVLRDGSSREESSVVFVTTTNGTAVPGVNFLPATNTVTFQPGDTEQNVPVRVFNTPQLANDTTVVMELSNAVNALLVSPSIETLTIRVTNSAPGQFLFTQTNYVVDEGGGFAVVTIMRTNGHKDQVSVNYATADGTATAGVNYTNTSGTLTFADQETLKTISVPLRDENQVEVGGFSTFTLGLSNPDNGATILGPTNTTVTILDNDVGVALSSPIYIATETDGSVTLTVNRVGANDVVQVNYATSDGTALAGTNYTAASGTLVFTNGQLLKTLNISLLRDPRVTGALSFGVNLFNAVDVSNPSVPVQIFTNNPATVTVKDADPGILFTNAAFGVLKSGTNVLITVQRTNVDTGTVSVNYATTNGTATAGVDYTATSGTLTFSNGIGLQSFSVPIINNHQVTGDRTFTVKLVTNALSGLAQLLPPSVATVTITDDVAGLSFSSAAYSVNESANASTITVLRTGYTNSAVAVNFATANGTGLAGTNYFANSGTLTFTNGDTAKTFFVTNIDDSQVTGDKTVLLGLSNPTGNSVLVNPNAAVLTILETDGSLVVPAGAALVSESAAPPNGAVDTNETVTVLLGLRDATGVNATNVIATLQTNSGVIPAPPNTPQNYGTLAVHGPSASRPFTFTANGTNGQTVTATLRLQYGTNVNFASFNFLLGSATTSYTNSGLIVINDFTNATPYPSVISVSGLGNSVTKATVMLTNLNHTWASDIDMVLVSPTGTNSLLMAKTGSGTTVSRATLTFDDAAANSLPASGPITNGTYRPTSYAGTSPMFPPPAPFGTEMGFYRTNLGTFKGSNPNGNWSLYIIDDSHFNSGAISNGWVLSLTTAGVVSGAADLALGMVASQNSVVATSNLSYTISVTNFGPSAASNVVVVDTLPADTTYVSSTPTQGAATTNSVSQLVWNVGTLPTNGMASLVLVVQPGVPETITNIATVSTSTSDPNPEDDSAVVLTTVAPPTADLALGMSVSPSPVLLGGKVTYTLTVSNLGPAAATVLALSDTLPATFQFDSAFPGGYTVNGNQVAYGNLGTLGGGSQTIITIVAKPTTAGTFTNSATCSSGVVDPSKGNNDASAKNIVEAMQLSRGPGGNLVLTWPADVGNFVLESTTNLSPPVVWVTNAPPPQIGGTNVFVIPLSGSGKMMFFRLHGQGP